jgi:hypothetical protein
MKKIRYKNVDDEIDLDEIVTFNVSMKLSTMLELKSLLADYFQLGSEYMFLTEDDAIILDVITEFAAHFKQCGLVNTSDIYVKS